MLVKLVMRRALDGREMLPERQFFSSLEEAQRYVESRDAAGTWPPGYEAWATTCSRLRLGADEWEEVAKSLADRREMG